MKKTSLIIALSAGLLVIGLLIGSIGFMLGGKSGFYMDLSGVHTYNDSARKKDTIALESFENVKLSCGSDEVTFVQSDRFAIEYDLEEHYAINQMEVSGDTLYVDIGRDFMVSFFNFSFGSDQLKDFVKIYYPAGTEFGDLDLGVTSGTLTGKDLTADEMKVKLSSGEFQMDGLTCDSADIGLTSGSSRLSGVKAGELSVVCSSGEINLSDAGVAGRLFMKTTSGDIKGDNIKAGNMEARLSSGNLTIDGLTAETVTGNITSGGFRGSGLDTNGLDFYASSGDIKLDGALAGTNKVRVTSGSVKLETSLSKEEYSLHAKATSGDIHVDGQEFSGEWERDTGNSFDVSTSSGDINLYFGK